MSEIAGKLARCISDVGKITAPEGETEGRMEVRKERAKNFRSREHSFATFFKVCATLKKFRYIISFLIMKRFNIVYEPNLFLIVVPVLCLKL